MGKSNKFDYSNRPNSGAKVGAIISTALQKEAEKLQKELDRHVQKARKHSAASIGRGPRLLTTIDREEAGLTVLYLGSEADPTRHLIDLKVPS